MTVKNVGQLVEEALEAFEDPAESTTTHVRRAIRIASKRQDYLALIRLVPETRDFSTGRQDHGVLKEAQVNLVALLGEEEAHRQDAAVTRRHIIDRRMDGKTDSVYSESIGQLEIQLAQYKELDESYKTIPSNLTPIDTYMVIRDFEKARAKLLPLVQDLENVIQRIKQATYDFLIETERQIAAGQRRPHVFDRGREYIERALQDRAPEALAKFRAAEELLGNGDPESLAHALTSCRRMIKALADALYPPTNAKVTGIDGRERKMTDAADRNRLLQFASERLGGGAFNDVVEETFRSLDSRLKKLYDLSSKGVHGEVSMAEAESCITWTYLMAADFLRIADGTAHTSSASN